MGSSHIPDQTRVREFFSSDAYLNRNPIVPVRAWLVRTLVDRDAPRVLDLGCGDGSVSRPLLDGASSLTLVDASAHMLQRALQSLPDDAEVRCVQADLMEFRAQGEYDVVLCIGVLAHVPSPEEAVARAAAAVSPGGLCILQITDSASPWGWLLSRYARIRPQSHQLNLTTRDWLIEAAGRHGLRPTQERRYALSLPGSGSLPPDWERWIEARAARSPTISRLGSELLVAFEKVR